MGTSTGHGPPTIRPSLPDLTKMLKRLGTTPISGICSRSKKATLGASDSSGVFSEQLSEFEIHSRKTKLHSRNGVSRLEHIEDHNSRSNSRSDSRNSWEPTCPHERFSFAPSFSERFFSRIGVVPARKRCTKNRFGRGQKRFWGKRGLYPLPKTAGFLEGCTGHAHKEHREKVLKVMNFRDCQGVFRVFSGYFQGVSGSFRVFSECFSLCPFRVCLWTLSSFDENDEWAFFRSLGTTPISKKGSRSEKAILGALGEFRGILGVALGIGNSILGLRNSVLGMASHDLSNMKTTILGATLRTIPGIAANPPERFSFAPAFLERFFKNWGGPRAPEFCP